VVQNQAGMLALAKGDRAGAPAVVRKGIVGERPNGGTPRGSCCAGPRGEEAGAGARTGRAASAEDAERQRRARARGRTWAATGDTTKGEELLHRAIDADASNLEAYSLLTGLYLSQQKLDQAIAELDKIAARRPKAVGPPTLAALILQVQGKEEEARRRYERLVEGNPRAAVAANNLAWTYASRGEQLDRALQLAQAAVAEDPGHPEFNDHACVRLPEEAVAVAGDSAAADRRGEGSEQPGVSLPSGSRVLADRRQGLRAPSP